MKRRIALISEHASPLAPAGGIDSGGQNVYVGQVARGLSRLGYRVDVFTRRDTPDLPERLSWLDGVQIVHVPAGPPAPLPKESLLPHMAEFSRRLTESCARADPGYDLLHANFWMSGLAAMAVKRALGIPFVITFHALGRVRRRHQGDSDGFPDERFAIEETVIAAADGIIAECPQDEEDLVCLYDADPRRVTIVPCGFDPDELSPVSREIARTALGLDRDARLILQLGRLVPRKGIETVIRALPRLNARCDLPARLLIAGGDSEEPNAEATPEIGRLRRIAEEYDVAEHVSFLGRIGREHLKYAYSAADIFVTTPWYEPFGITPVEAMACGTPVVGAAVGGIKYSVRDGETGYLVPPNDPEALAERLAHLLSHPDLGERLGRRARLRAVREFTWGHVVAALANLYDGILAGANGERERAAVVDDAFFAVAAGLEGARSALRTAILQAADTLATAFWRGGKLLICGNGGSAAEAQHLAAEFVGRFKRAGRRALPAIALTADSAVLTAWANDASYDDIFARQVEALGAPGDVLIGISTSGRSPNVVQALDRAREGGLRTVALLGGSGGDAARIAEHPLVVPAADTQHIQEVHTVIVHVLCDLVEQQLAAWEDAPLADVVEASRTWAPVEQVRPAAEG